MRADCRYLVKRYAPLIGMPTSPRRVAVEARTSTLAEALERVATIRRHGAYWRRRALEARDDRDGYVSAVVAWHDRAAFWIEHATAPATARRRGGRG